MSSTPLPLFCTPAFPGHDENQKHVHRLEDALVAAYAADGCSRVTGEPALLLTCGRAEALRAASAMPVVWGEGVPIVAVNVVPQADLESIGRVYAPVVRGSLSMEQGDDPTTLAVAVARTLGKGAPVQLRVPDTVDLGRLVDALVKLEVPPDGPGSDPPAGSLEEIEGALRGARRPVLVLDREAMARTDFTAIGELAAALQTPILLTAGATTSIGHLPQSWVTLAAHAPLIPQPNVVWILTLAAADVVLALGSSLPEADLFGLHDIRLPLGPVYCVGLRELGSEKLCRPVKADPSRFVEKLLERVVDWPRDHDRRRWVDLTASRLRELERVLVDEAKKGEALDRVVPELASYWIARRHPRDISRPGAMRRAATIFLAEGNSTGMWLRSYLHFEPVVYPAIMASIGHMFGWAVGARIGRPNHALWGVVGDGSFFFQSKVLRTLQQRKVPAVFFVFNNSAWDSIRLEQTFFFLSRYVGTELPATDLARVARWHGCKGVRVTSRHELGEAIKKAQSWHLEGEVPLVIDVALEKDTIPFTGLAFALAELDYIVGAMKQRFARSLLVSASRGRLPLRLVWMVLRLLL